MHEASIVQGLLELANSAIGTYMANSDMAKAPLVKEIICQAGLLSCLEPETLSACFEIFAENTFCEGAELIIETAPLKCECENCRREFELTKRKFVCPFCESGQIRFSGGNGLILKEINLYKEEDDG